MLYIGIKPDCNWYTVNREKQEQSHCNLGLRVSLDAAEVRDAFVTFVAQRQGEFLRTSISNDLSLSCSGKMTLGNRTPWRKGSSLHFGFLLLSASFVFSSAAAGTRRIAPDLSHNSSL